MAKPKTYSFATVADMHAIPLDKIEAFCTDLRLWLQQHRLYEQANAELRKAGSPVTLAVTTPTEVFVWIDDGKHEVTHRIEDPAGLLAKLSEFVEKSR